MRAVVLLSLDGVLLAMSSAAQAQDGGANGRSSYSQYDDPVTFDRSYRPDGSAGDFDQAYNDQGGDYGYQSDNYAYPVGSSYRIDRGYRRQDDLVFNYIENDNRNRSGYYDRDYRDYYGSGYDASSYRERRRYDDYDRRRRVGRYAGHIVGDLVESLISGD